MQRRLFWAGLSATLALSSACDQATGPTINTTPLPTTVGSGVIVSEARPAEGFAALTVDGPLQVVVEQTGAESLVITADDNIVPLVTSEVRGGRLFLGYVPRASFSSTRGVVCRVTAAAVRDLGATGAARVEMKGVDLDRLDARLSGASTLEAAGTVERLALDVSGASRWSSAGLGSRTVTAEVTGTSYALVRAGDQLVATVSGVSVVEYVGDPVVTPSVSGLSVLRRVGP